MLTCGASRALQAKRAQCTFGTLLLATIRNNQKKTTRKAQSVLVKRARAIGVSFVNYFEPETNNRNKNPRHSTPNVGDFWIRISFYMHVPVFFLTAVFLNTTAIICSPAFRT